MVTKDSIASTAEAKVRETQPKHRQHVRKLVLLVLIMSYYNQTHLFLTLKISTGLLTSYEHGQPSLPSSSQENKENHQNAHLQDNNVVEETNDEQNPYLRDLMWGLEKENDSLRALMHKRRKENMFLRDYVWGLDKESASLRALLRKKNEENGSLWESASLLHLYHEKMKFMKSLEALERRHPQLPTAFF